jgi:type IV pilus assembly protein PilA
MICHACGVQATDAQRFCAACGKPLRADVGPAPLDVYAAFGRRLTAYLIDELIVLMVAALIISAVRHPGLGTTFAILLLSNGVYRAGMEGSALQATFGKRLLDIKVTSLRGTPIGLAHAIARHLAFLLDATVTLKIGFLIAVFTARRQAFHDVLARTLVTRRSFTVEEIRDAPPAPSAGAAAAFVMLGVAVLLVMMMGIIAAIAIPAYQDYTARTQVVEGLRLVAPVENAVGQALIAGKDPATINNESLGLTANATAQYVTAIEVKNAAVSVSFGRTANRGINGHHLLFYPVRSGNELTWACGFAAVTGTRLDRGDPAFSTTDIAQKFLPSRCRSE